MVVRSELAGPSVAMIFALRWRRIVVYSLMRNWLRRMYFGSGRLGDIGT
jgi:hypothetical protein